MNLRELSEKLGLSQTTVSRALNGYPDVSEATRQRIKQAAQDFGYTPNVRARALAMGRAMAIGHVISAVSGHEMLNPVFNDCTAGASEAYSAAGYDLVMSIVGNDEELATYRALSKRHAVDGVLVQGARENDPRIALLKELRMPFVVHGRVPIADDDYSWVDVNNLRAFRHATERLVAFGHKRIALINGAEMFDFARRRRRGFEQAMADAKLPVDPALLASGAMTDSFGYTSAAKMLDLGPNAPTAFLVSSIVMAHGVQRAVERAGLSLGRDVSLIVFDDDLSYLRNQTEDGPVFAAMRSSVRDAARRAGEILIAQIEDPTRPPQHVLMEVEQIDGPTLGPAP